MKSIVLACFGSFLVAFSPDALGQRPPIPERPNILFIYTDDQGVWTPGVYGNRQAHTPNMDRLAAEGARFTRAFATAPVCSAARASLMTGRYSSETGVHDAISPPDWKTYRETIGRGLGMKGLSGAFTTFPEVLATAGYTNGLIGKWHLGEFASTTNKRYHPLNHGFHYFMGMPHGGAKPSGAVLEEEGTLREFPGLIDDVLVDRAIGFMERHAGQPFLLCLNLRAPHLRYLPIAEGIWDMYKDRDVEVPSPDYPDLDIERLKPLVREYTAAVANLDRNVGDVLQALDRLGLAGRTIVIFTSDHGYSMGQNGVYEKGNGVWITRTIPPATENIWAGDRPNLHDISLQVPAIVRWPAVAKPGSVITQAVSSVDWYPTIVEAAGARVPDAVVLRGRSLVPLLQGKNPPRWDNEIYAEYNMDNRSHARMRSIRTEDWKLIRDFLNEGRDELYHVGVDPEERHNRIMETDPEITAIRATLEQKILQRMRQYNDPLLLAAE